MNEIRRAFGMVVVGITTLSGVQQASAQDLTMAELEWVNPSFSPETLPVLPQQRLTELNEAARSITEPAYTEYHRLIDTEGRAFSTYIANSHPLLVVSLRSDPSAKSAQPARRDGKPVVSEVRQIIIFNPATAKVRGADATPRLLKVVPSRFPDNSEAPQKAIEKVEVTLSIDEQGRVNAVEPDQAAPKSYRDAAVRAAQKWEFAPARQGGVPVAATVRTAVLFTPPATLELTSISHKPRPTFQVSPVYPVNLHRAGIAGEVLVSLVVTREGRTADVYAISSTNPDLAEAAIDSVEQWRFDPGEVDGRPVNTRLRVPIIFNIEGGGRQSFTIKAPKKWTDDFPEAMRFEVAPKVTGVNMPVYPYDALLAKKSGKVTVQMIIGPEGKIVKAAAVLPADPDFATAAVIAAETWTFTPPARQGQPCFAGISFEFEFKSNGLGSASVSAGNKRMLKLIQDDPEKIYTLGEIDAMPHPISRKAPITPLALQVSREKGEALIEFYIDRKGFARLPRVLSATTPEAGEAAVLGVAAWRFEAPLKDGKAVAVKARIPITFN